MYVLLSRIDILRLSRGGILSTLKIFLCLYNLLQTQDATQAPHRLRVLSSLETFFFFPTKICTMSSANLKVTLQRKMFQKLLEKQMVLIKHQLSLFNIYDDVGIK